MIGFRMSLQHTRPHRPSPRAQRSTIPAHHLRGMPCRHPLRCMEAVRTFLTRTTNQSRQIESRRTCRVNLQLSPGCQHSIFLPCHRSPHKLHQSINMTQSRQQALSSHCMFGQSMLYPSITVRCPDESSTTLRFSTFCEFQKQQQSPSTKQASSVGARALGENTLLVHEL